MIIWENPQGI